MVVKLSCMSVDTSMMTLSYLGEGEIEEVMHGKGACHAFMIFNMLKKVVQ